MGYAIVAWVVLSYLMTYCFCKRNKWLKILMACSVMGNLRADTSRVATVVALRCAAVNLRMIGHEPAGKGQKKLSDAHN